MWILQIKPFLSGQVWKDKFVLVAGGILYLTIQTTYLGIYTPLATNFMVLGAFASQGETELMALPVLPLVLNEIATKKLYRREYLVFDY